MDPPRYMDELTIMEVPEPAGSGSPGNLLMEQVPRVREGLTRGRDWRALATEAASGVFHSYDDADDPDVRSAAALFAGSEHEDWLSEDTLSGQETGGSEEGARGLEEGLKGTAPSTSVRP